MERIGFIISNDLEVGDEVNIKITNIKDDGTVSFEQKIKKGNKPKSEAKIIKENNNFSEKYKRIHPSKLRIEQIARSNIPIKPMKNTKHGNYVVKIAEDINSGELIIIPANNEFFTTICIIKNFMPYRGINELKIISTGSSFVIAEVISSEKIKSLKINTEESVKKLQRKFH